MAELLLELFSEEIPAWMQDGACADLERLVTGRLSEAGIEFARAEAFATPRRLALVVEDLPERQPDVREERRGPRVGSPEAAIAGFLKSVGLARIEDCEQRDTGNGVFYFAVVERKGRPTAELLSEFLPEVIANFPWPKSMRWGTGGLRWARPLHSLLCLFAGRVVPIALDAGVGLRAGSVTFGHRVLAPGPIEVGGFADYRDKLARSFVMLDPAERRAAIREQAEKLAAAEGLRLKPDEALVAEVAGLVEWPVAVMASIDRAFLDLPPEVMTSAMRSHQRYFALERPDGTLAPRFITVANTQTEDGGKQVAAGNERVLRARLADAKFFWDLDRKRPLESRVPALGQVVFHAKLGTLADKVERIEALAAELANYIPGADVDRVRSAALLAKADLTTGMVGEFPDLQGVIGRYYALAEGEKADVADAIRDHYAPQGPADRCPSAPVSVAVALADKIDSLVGFFAIGEKPTGSKDPFALRRAALGVIRLILENRLRIPLNAVIAESRRLFPAVRGAGGDALAAELLAFFADRLKVHLRDKGVRHDLIAAVFALGGEDDLVRLLARVDALARFVETEDGADLLVAYRRAGNIVRIEEGRDKLRYDGPVDPALFVQDEERALQARLAEAAAAFGPALAAEDFAAAMAALARLRPAVDAFFDKVTVNCPEADRRANRLRLLSQIRATMGRIADFSKVEG